MKFSYWPYFTSNILSNKRYFFLVALLGVHSKSVQQTKKRFLGFIETAMHIQHQYAEGASCVGAIMQVSGNINANKIKNALIDLVKRHPLLRAKLINLQNAPLIEIECDMPKAIPFKILKRTFDSFSAKFLEKILDKPLFSTSAESSNHLWEIFLAKNENNQEGPHELILKAHHAIFDGISIGIFMQDLLYAYNGEKIGDSLPILPPAENMLLRQVNWTRFLFNHLLSLLWNELFGQKDMTTYRKHECQSKFSDRKTKISFKKFNKAEVRVLIKICHDNGITLTALLTAALLKATREVCGGLAVETISTPLSVRSYFQKDIPNETTIGCYVAKQVIKLPIQDEMTIWEIAKNYKTKLARYLPVTYPANFVPAMWKQKIIKREMLLHQDKFIQGVSVSNLGKTNFAKHFKLSDELKLMSLNVCASMRAGVMAIQLFIVTSKSELNLCFAYAKPTLSVMTAKAIEEKTLLIINTLIKDIK